MGKKTRIPRKNEDFPPCRTLENLGQGVAPKTKKKPNVEHVDDQRKKKRGERENREGWLCQEWLWMTWTSGTFAIRFITAFSCFGSFTAELPKRLLISRCPSTVLRTVCWPQGSMGAEGFGCILRNAGNNLGRIPQTWELQISETGRIRFRRVRFQTPNSVSFSRLTEFWGAHSVSSFQPIICMPTQTHRVFRRTHRVCPKTQ